jgi:hypothetical protein
MKSPTAVPEIPMSWEAYLWNTVHKVRELTKAGDNEEANKTLEEWSMSLNKLCTWFYQQGLSR